MSDGSIMAQLMRRLELDVEWLNLLAELGSCVRPCGKATVIQLRAGMGTDGSSGVDALDFGCVGCVV